MGDKIDVKRTLDGYRATRGEFRIVDIPEHRYLAIDGSGNPNTAPTFAEAIETLYPVAYTLKFASKRELGRDYVVPPLEGLWWADDPSAFTTARDKALWEWRLLLLVPEWLDDERVAAAIEAVRAKKGTPPARLDDVRVELLAEGRCVQTLHVGSFDDEAGVLARMHDEFMPANGLTFAGMHHEIYLSDFRRTAPERQRTILRQPVRDASSGD